MVVFCGCGLTGSRFFFKSEDKYFFYLNFTEFHMGCQKVPKFDFQSIFNVKYHMNRSENMLFENICLEECFLSMTSFDNFNF